MIFYRHFTTLSHSQTAWVQKLLLKVVDSSLRRHVFTSCFYRSLISFLVANFKLNGPLVLLLVGYIHMIKWWLVLCLVAGEMFWRDQGPVSRKSRNFSGEFRVTYFSLYLQNKSVSRHETLQLFEIVFPLQHIKRPALQNKRVAVLEMAFRARKVLGTFEKRAPGPGCSKHG